MMLKERSMNYSFIEERFKSLLFKYIFNVRYAIKTVFFDQRLKKPHKQFGQGKIEL